MQEFRGSLEDAQKAWPARTAVGKLNVVQAEGKEARLVLDSTVRNANLLCFVPEHVRLPTSMDVARTFEHDDPYGQFVGLSLDFKAAHKCVNVRQDEQGCLLFQRAGKLCHYTVCHFGAKFSAYWWQRVGGLLLRIMRALLAPFSHKAWLYVDDLLDLRSKRGTLRSVHPNMWQHFLHALPSLHALQQASGCL